MTREAIPFIVPDLSQFARTLGRSLKERHSIKPEPPGHVELLNLLARASGYRNVQSLRVAASRLPSAASAKEAVSAPSIGTAARKALTQFDAHGRLARWPHKFSVQRVAMWVLWTLFDAKRVYTECQVNEILKAWHTYGDHVTLRRELINHKLLTRKSDCSEYRKLPMRPDDDARWLINAWRKMRHPVASGSRPSARGAPTA